MQTMRRSCSTINILNVIDNTGSTREEWLRDEIAELFDLFYQEFKGGKSPMTKEIQINLCLPDLRVK